MSAVAGAWLLFGAAGCRDCSKPVGDGVPSGEADAGVMNATVVPTASVAAMLNPDGLPAYSGPTGSVEGTIQVVGDPPEATPADFTRCPAAAKIWGTSYRVGASGDAGATQAGDREAPRALADAVVAVTGYKGFYVPVKDEARSISIEGCGYQSRTATLTFGQRLEVKNLSADFWSPVLEPGRAPALMMAPPKGDPVRLYPKKPGHYLLVDHDRKYVVVDVYAFLHPLHTASDLTGHYRIDGIPVGKVTVNTTHPRFDGEASAEITIEPGIIQRVDLVLRHTLRDGGSPPAMDAGFRPPIH